jgi:ubiquinone/menaquinone biosynthesis C-methylase UbiE
MTLTFKNIYASSNGIEMPKQKVTVSRQQLPGWAIRMVKLARGAGLRLLDPPDYLLRIVSGKRDLPSLYLRRYVGPLSSFETSGAEFVAYLKLIANLASYESILDVGCGCGLIALGLRNYLSKEGRYLGLDIHKPSISWCQRAIQDKYPHFTFELIDVHNVTYNPGGKHPAENYAFPVANASFDVVLLKSVFTHMRPAEVENYLREVARVLKPNGRCLATLFLFDADPTQEAKNGYTNLTFQFGDNDWRYEYKNSSDTAIAYSRRFTLNALAKQGLLLSRLLPGTWRNRQHGISYQDMLLIEKS